MSLRRIDVTVVMVTVVVMVTRVVMATEQLVHQQPASSAQEQVKTYEGYRVYDVRVSGKREAARVVREAQLCSAELWNDDQTAGTLQLQVGPGDALPLESALNRSGVYYQLRIDDIQRLIDEQSAQNRNDTGRDDHFRHDVYHTFSEIRRHLERQSIDHADRMLLEVIGVSHERRPLYLARLTSSTVSQPHRPIMWLDCGIHAREWVSPAICLYIIDRLLNEDKVWLLHYDWHIAPMLNPDGYVYSHEHDRLWRKNRSDNHYCRGVDLNRNFAAFWGTFGVTFFECGATFPGYRPFSEPESRAVRDAVLRHRGRVAAFSSIHSYGQLWLVPYGYKWFRSPHWRQHKRVARRATQAMRAVNGVPYRHGISSLMLYLDSGTSTDWAYREGVKHSVAIEARDLGYYGFLLPPHFILPTAAEVWAGLLAQAEAVLR